MGYLIALLLLASCGSRLPLVTGAGPAATLTTPVDKQGVFITGSLQKADGTWLDLSVAPAQPRILIFSQDSCSVCRGEARSLAEQIHTLGHPPTNTDIITVLVGAELADAADWIDDLQTTWTVTIDSPTNLMNHYCTPNLFPCSVIETPKDGIVFTHTGRVEINEYETYTGAWK